MFLDVIHGNAIPWTFGLPRFLTSGIAEREAAADAQPNLLFERPALGSRAFAVARKLRVRSAAAAGSSCVIRRIVDDKIDLLFEFSANVGSIYTVTLKDTDRRIRCVVEECESNGSGEFFYAVTLRCL